MLIFQQVENWFGNKYINLQKYQSHVYKRASYIFAIYISQHVNVIKASLWTIFAKILPIV